MIICDQQRRILLVDPKYKPDWDLPGGMSEANEPPAATGRREVKEELDLDLQPGRLLCIDWVFPHGPWDDSLMLIFDGGTLTSERISRLKLLDGELRAFEFCTGEEAADRLRPYLWQRAAHALQAQKTGETRYLQDGQLHHHLSA